MAIISRQSRKQARRLVPAPPFTPRIAERRLAVGKAKSPIPFKGNVRRPPPPKPKFIRIANRRFAASPQRDPPPWPGRAGRHSFSIRELRDPFCICEAEVYVSGAIAAEVYASGQASAASASDGIGEVYTSGARVGQIGCEC